MLVIYLPENEKNGERAEIETLPDVGEGKKIGSALYIVTGTTLHETFKHGAPEATIHLIRI